MLKCGLYINGHDCRNKSVNTSVNPMPSSTTGVNHRTHHSLQAPGERVAQKYIFFKYFTFFPGSKWGIVCGVLYSNGCLAETRRLTALTGKLSGKSAESHSSLPSRLLGESCRDKALFHLFTNSYFLSNAEIGKTCRGSIFRSIKNTFYKRKNCLHTREKERGERNYEADNIDIVWEQQHPGACSGL